MATTPTLPAADPDDWLGYGAYADALWSRVVRALDKDKGGRPLGDDPLVIGIFGEWGAGKSHLLKLVYQRAAEQSARDIAARVLTAADDLTVPITVTVPVMFQPWKYEHEPHLHVPLAIHVADALEDAWKKLPTDFEHVKEFVERATEGLADAGEKLEAAKGVMVQIGKIWEATKQVVHSNVTKVVAGTVDVAAMSFGAPPLISGLLSKAKNHVAEPDDESEDVAEEGKSKGADKDKKTAKKTAADKRTTSFSHSEDGLAFYRIHKLMQAMTRPKIDAKTLSNAGLKIAKGIEFDLRINFVVFVDDLDRCLPEKAVETLELIKTTFNIESFAFVLALDDEVIERGIGHRYKEYQLVGKKPEMPITGFEYLEKIVHVPFRLPALTRAQASEFVRQYERDIEPDAALHWFEPVAFQPDALQAGGAPSSRGMQKPDLLELALSGFDAFMPRKLIRMVELMHQVAKIAAIRNAPLQVTTSGGVDVRVVMVLLLIQLFQPELYRILRRREESFPALLAAFAKKDDGTKEGTWELADARVSDIDLWQWAVHASHAGVRQAWSPPNFEQTYGYAVLQIAVTHKDDSFERVNAQIIRLPMVAQIIGHRAVNRHVFDVLKLVTALASSMEATNSEPRRLTFRPYLSLLSQQTTLAKALTEVTAPAQVTVTGTATLTETDPKTASDTRLRFDLRSVDDLAASLLSSDEAVQANLASRIDLREGEVLSASSAAELINSLTASFATLAKLNDGSFEKSKVNLLNGLRYLAAYLAAADAKSLWQLVNDSVDFVKPIEPKTRALWGEVRDLLGCDKRFEARCPHLLKDRFNGQVAEDEPIPGFVRIPPGEFAMGSNADGDNPLKQIAIGKTYYISRTLVTVQQFARFIELGGYKDRNTWWDSQGEQWRNESSHGEGSDDTYRKWLLTRGFDFRHRPLRWEEQEKQLSRPVCGVNWFEARAYARWLNSELRASIESVGLDSGWEIMLPTEVQWERAALAASKTTAKIQRWPWGNDEESAEQCANVGNSLRSACGVGLYPSNPIGLCDMAGNVWEWMDNLYTFKPNDFARIRNGQKLAGLMSPGKLDLPASRGGSWSVDIEDARCACRNKFDPFECSSDLGFRVVLSLAD